jgi:hypothetical protein
MEEDKKNFGLRKNINKAAAIRTMCQTPGFKVLRKAFEDQVKKATKKILNPEMSDEDVKKLRARVQIWMEIEKILKDLMMKGELSKRALDMMEE